MTFKQSSPRWTLMLTSLAFFMVALDALVVATALPAIQHDLKDADAGGPRGTGVGAAAVMPLSLTILSAAFPAERRGAVVGIWGAIGGLAVASGPVIGGAITQGIDWHWIFWVNVPIGLAAIALARVRLDESYGPPSRVDLLGLGLVTAAALSLVWALVRSGDLGWGSPETLLTLTAGVALLAAFVLCERRAEAPMLPPRLFADRTFAAANGTAFVMVASIMAAAFLIAQYFQFVLGNTPLSTGLRLLPWTTTPIVVAPAAGALSDRVGPRPIMATGDAAPGRGSRLVRPSGDHRCELRDAHRAAGRRGYRDLDGPPHDPRRSHRRGDAG
jgi:MFS family permease